MNEAWPSAHGESLRSLVVQTADALRNRVADCVVKNMSPAAIDALSAGLIALLGSKVWPKSREKVSEPIPGWFFSVLGRDTEFLIRSIFNSSKSEDIRALMVQYKATLHQKLSVIPPYQWQEFERHFHNFLFTLSKGSEIHQELLLEILDDFIGRVAAKQF